MIPTIVRILRCPLSPVGMHDTCHISQVVPYDRRSGIQIIAIAMYQMYWVSSGQPHFSVSVEALRESRVE